MVSREGQHDRRELIYLTSEGVITPEEASDYPILMHGPAIMPHGQHVVACYRDVESMVAAADHLAVGPRVRHVQRTLRELTELRSPEVDETMRLQQLAVERVRSGLEGFMKALGSDRLTDEIEQRAMAGRSPLEPPVFDPVIFYDRPFETSPPKEAPKGAASLPLPGGFFPVLGWFGWDNRARCARVLGGAWLFENDWFGGRFAYIEGLGINDTGLIPFYDLGFDRIASSAIVI